MKPKPASREYSRESVKERKELLSKHGKTFVEADQRANRISVQIDKIFNFMKYSQNQKKNMSYDLHWYKSVWHKA